MWLVRTVGGEEARDTKSQGSRDVPRCAGGLQGNKPTGGGLSSLDDSPPFSLLPTFRKRWCLKSSGPQRKPHQGHTKGHLLLGTF